MFRKSRPQGVQKVIISGNKKGEQNYEKKNVSNRSSSNPGTGTPEAGGVSFIELLEAIRTVSQVNVVGADVNELAPMLDASGVSTATACKVLRELLLAVAK